ncbi:Maf family protein [Euryarchaeota archaeon]|nr:Maf family protein [Euryarchaeota archaeon]
MRVLLASASKRRLSCLEDILDLEIYTQALFSEEKDLITGKSVEVQVTEICFSKAENAAIEWSVIEKEKEKIPEIIIVSDTIVEDPDDPMNPMGKPKNEFQATNMLLRLSGKRHRVWSSTAILTKNNQEYRPIHGEWKYKIWTNYSVVEFNELTDEDIISLIESSSWDGKAGGYDLAGDANEYTKLIHGDELTVLGFSFEAVNELKSKLL